MTPFLKVLWTNLATPYSELSLFSSRTPEVASKNKVTQIPQDESKFSEVLKLSHVLQHFTVLLSGQHATEVEKQQELSKLV